MYAFHLAFVSDKEVAEEHAQWRNSEPKSRLGAAQPSVGEGAGAAIPASVGEECNRAFGQELVGEEGKSRAGLARGARVAELDAWEHYKARRPLKVGGISEAVSNTKRATSWEAADGEKCVRARQGAKASRCPDLIDGSVDASGCVSLRPRRLRIISLGALDKRMVWALSSRIALWERAHMVGTFFYAPPSNGIPRVQIAFGSSMRRAIV